MIHVPYILLTQRMAGVAAYGRPTSAHRLMLLYIVRFQFVGWDSVTIDSESVLDFSRDVSSIRGN